MSINRCLDDKAMDHIDHALGRPLDPRCDSYRNYFAASGSIAEEMARSEHWVEGRKNGELRCFAVTPAGRIALAAHLHTIGDQNRAWCITYRGHESIVIAESRSKARYSHFLDLKDVCPDLTFKDFSKGASVRLASRAQPASPLNQEADRG